MAATNMDIAVRILAYDLASGGMNGFANSMRGLGAAALELGVGLGGSNSRLLEIAQSSSLFGGAVRTASAAVADTQSRLTALTLDLGLAKEALNQAKTNSQAAAQAVRDLEQALAAARKGGYSSQYAIESELKRARVAAQDAATAEGQAADEVVLAQRRIGQATISARQATEDEEAAAAQLGQQIALLGGFTAAAAADLLAFAGGLKMATDAGGQLQMATVMAGIAISDGTQHVGELEDAITTFANNSQYKIADVDQSFRILGERGFNTAQIIGKGGLGQAALDLGQAMGDTAVNGADVLSQAMKLFDLNADQSNTTADKLTRAFYDGMNSADGLSQFMGMSAGTAKMLGVSLTDLLTVGDMLTPMMGSASSAGAALNYAMNNMVKPTATAGKELANLGIISVNQASPALKAVEQAIVKAGDSSRQQVTAWSGTYTGLQSIFAAGQRVGAIPLDMNFNDWSNSADILNNKLVDQSGKFVGLKGALDVIITAFQQGHLTADQMQVAIGTLFNVRSGRGIADLVSQLGNFDTRYQQISTDIQKTGTAQDDANRINETAEGSWKRLTSTFNDFFAKAGLVINQALIPLYDGLNNLLSEAQQHPTITKFFAAFLVGGAALAAVAVAVGGLLIVLTLFAAAIGPIVAVMVGIAVVAAGVAGAWALLTSKGKEFTGWLSFLNPILDPIRATFENLWADLQKNASAWSFLLPVVKAVGIALAVLVGVIVIGPFVALGLAILAIADAVTGAIAWVQKWMGILHNFYPVIADLGTLLRDVFTGQWGKIAADSLQIQRDWNAGVKALADQQAADAKKIADKEALDAEQAALKKKKAVLDAAASEADAKAKQAKIEADDDIRMANQAKDGATKAALLKAAGVARAQQHEQEQVAASARAESGQVSQEMTTLQRNASASAQATAQQVVAHLTNMTGGSITQSHRIRQEVTADLNDMQRDGIADAVKLAQGVNGQMQTMSQQTGHWGKDAALNFASGLLSGQGNVDYAVNQLVLRVASKMQHSVPKEGPLAHDDEWGGHLVENFATGMLSRIGTVEQAAHQVGTAIAGTLPQQAGVGITAAMQQLQLQASLATGSSQASQPIILQNILDGKVIEQTVFDRASQRLKPAGTTRLGR